MTEVKTKTAKKGVSSGVKKKTHATPALTHGLKGFAIVETGGKQYKVSSGDVLLVEKMSDVHKPGDTIILNKVVLLSDGKTMTFGDPYIQGATVNAIFENAVRGKKIDVLKFKSKSRWTRRWGHRQPYAKIKIL